MLRAHPKSVLLIEEQGKRDWRSVWRVIERETTTAGLSRRSWIVADNMRWPAAHDLFEEIKHGKYRFVFRPRSTTQPAFDNWYFK